MAAPQIQPKNLFTTTFFLSLASAILTASIPNIVDIVKNGGTVEKYLYLVVAVLSGAGVSAEKMRKEEELYTPNWFPLGKNKKEVLENPQLQVPLLKEDESVQTITNNEN